MIHTPLICLTLAAALAAAASAHAQDTTRKVEPGRGGAIVFDTTRKLPRDYLGAVRFDSARRVPAAAQGADARALLRLEDEWAAALVRRDGATFRRLMDPRFVYTEDDRLMGRDELIRDLVSGSDTVQSARNEDMQVHQFGATAVVTGWLVIQGRGAGGPFDNRYRFTDTWIRRGGRWQIVAAQDYLKPAPGR